MVSTGAANSALSDCTDNSHSDHSCQGELILEADVEKSGIQLLLSSAEQELSRLSRDPADDDMSQDKSSAGIRRAYTNQGNSNSNEGGLKQKGGGSKKKEGRSEVGVVRRSTRNTRKAILASSDEEQEPKKATKKKKTPSSSKKNNQKTSNKKSSTKKKDLPTALLLEKKAAQNAETKISRLEGRITELEIKLAERKGEIEGLAKENSKLKSKVWNEVEKNEKLHDKINEFERKLRSKTQELGDSSKKITELKNEVRDSERKQRKAEEALAKAKEQDKGTFEEQVARDKARYDFELAVLREKNKTALIAKEKLVLRGHEQRELVEHRAACNMEVQVNKLKVKEQERKSLTNARTLRMQEALAGKKGYEKKFSSKFARVQYGSLSPSDDDSLQERKRHHKKSKRKHRHTKRRRKSSYSSRRRRHISSSSDSYSTSSESEDEMDRKPKKRTKKTSAQENTSFQEISICDNVGEEAAPLRGSQSSCKVSDVDEMDSVEFL